MAEAHAGHSGTPAGGGTITANGRVGNTALSVRVRLGRRALPGRQQGRGGPMVIKVGAAAVAIAAVTLVAEGAGRLPRAGPRARFRRARSGSLRTRVPTVCTRCIRARRPSSTSPAGQRPHARSSTGGDWRAACPVWTATRSPWGQGSPSTGVERARAWWSEPRVPPEILRAARRDRRPVVGQAGGASESPVAPADGGSCQLIEVGRLRSPLLAVR